MLYNVSLWGMCCCAVLYVLSGIGGPYAVMYSVGGLLHFS